MDRGDPPGLGQNLQHLPDVAEIDHAALARGGDVGGEDLDARVPGGDRFGELRQDLRGDLALHHRVKGVVAMAVAGPFLLAPLDRLLHAVAVADQGEIDDRGRAAMQCRLADAGRAFGHLVLGGAGHDDRPAAMHMRVDPAGDDDLAGGVDDAPGADRGEAARRADRRDLLAENADIGRLRPRGQHGEPARDNDVQHVSLPMMTCQYRRRGKGEMREDLGPRGSRAR